MRPFKRMKKSLIFVFLFTANLSWAQYYPRGTNLNDGYLPNLDQPDKWMISLDGGFDWQREEIGGQNVNYQVTHTQFNLFYGGQVFRGGVQVIHDLAREVKDLSVGVGFAYSRPLFFELGIGYLNRVLSNQSFDGTAINAKIGYNVEWIMRVNYRVRIRLAFAASRKSINSGGDQNVLHFYPLLGLEFET